MTARREDLFVSVCVPDLPPDALAPFRALAAALDRHYRYWEILVGAPADRDTDREYGALMAASSNLRLLKLRPGTPFYRRRAALAAEAIGDVVVLTSAEELASADLPVLIEAAAREARIVILRRPRIRVGAANSLLRALGRSAGFRVNLRDMQTAAYPRTLLNHLLAQPERPLALRFPPADSRIAVRWIEAAAGPLPAPRGLREIGRRLGLMHKLLTSSAPRVLMLVALLSLGVAGVALAYMAYAVLVWLFAAAVMPGWFTLSLVLGMLSLFIALAFFGLSIGLYKLIEKLSVEVEADVVEERSTLDLFGQVMTELNVEIGGEGEPQEDAAGPSPAGSATGPAEDRSAGDRSGGDRSAGPAGPTSGPAGGPFPAVPGLPPGALAMALPDPPRPPGPFPDPLMGPPGGRR